MPKERSKKQKARGEKGYKMLPNLRSAMIVVKNRADRDTSPVNVARLATR